MPTMKTSLVTGADGFIGRALTARLTSDGVRVVRLVHRPSGPDAIVADLGRTPVPHLSEVRPEVVFHLAARVHKSDRGSASEQEHFRVTVEGTRDLLDAAIRAGTQSFVFFSSCSVMPERFDGVVDETSKPAPTTPYGRAKLEAETLVLSMNGAGGLRTVCLRLPLVYGPGQKGNLPRMIRAVQRRIFPPLPDFGGKRSVVHVDDVVDAALLVADEQKAAGKVYLITEPHAYTSREMYDIVQKALGRTPPRWQVPLTLFEIMASVGDLGGRIARRRMPFDSQTLSKLSGQALYSSGLIERELGFTTSRDFESEIPRLLSHRVPQG
jgi:nucleoside-diphosphate-sugar epimerase